MAERKPRGFAAMDADKQRQIASKGGKAAHAKGTAHQFTPEEARAAGRKGGQAAHAKGTAHEFTPEEARAAGRKGGQSSHAGRSRTTQNPQDNGQNFQGGQETQGGSNFQGLSGQGSNMPSTGMGQGSTNFENRPAACPTPQGQPSNAGQGMENRTPQNV